MKHFSFRRRALASHITAVLAGVTVAASGAMAQVNEATSQQNNPASNNALEETFVVGLKASLKRNIDLKRNTIGVSDSITSEDIGKMPDVTIADTLQRIPGVQIRREAGEGSTINVRGMPQVTALMNGEQFLSAGSITTVQPDFTDVPSSLISGITVHKAPTASLLAGGISGTLDLKSVRPFDLDSGYTFATNAELSEGELSEDDDGKLSGFMGFNGDNYGFVVTATFDEKKLANYRNGTILDSMEVLQENQRDQRDFNGDGDLDDSFLSQRFYGIMDKEVERDRFGISTTFQANVTDSLEFIGDVFYTEMEDANRQQGMMIDSSRGNNWAFSDSFDLRTDVPSMTQDAAGSVVDGGVSRRDLYTTNNADLLVRRVSSYSESLTNDRESTNINLELNYKGDGPLSGSVRYLRGDAERTHTENVAHGYLTSGGQHGLLRNDGSGPEPANPRGITDDYVPVQFDRNGEYISLAFADGVGSDISQYNLVSTYSENNFTEEATLDVLRADGSYEFEMNHLTSVDFGVRSGSRDVERDTYILVAPVSTDDVNSFSADVMWKDSGAALGDTNGDGERSVAGGDLTIGQPFFYTDLPDGWVNEVTDFGPGSIPGTFYLINPEVLDDNIASQNVLYPGNKKLTRPSRSYAVEEHTNTLYFQANFAGVLGGMNYSANAGARYIETELDILNNIVDTTSRPCSLCTAAEKTGEDRIKRDYSDFLPAVNFALDINEDLVFRAGYAKTLTSLDIDDLAGGLSVGRSRAGDILGAQLGVNPDLLVAINGRQNGNPELDPWRATNYNASLEWYFGDNSLLSAGLFRMEIDSFTQNGSVIRGLPDEDGVIRRELPVDTLVNGEGGTIEGIELAYQQAFDFLPGVFSGLGTTINFTYAPSDSSNTDLNGNKLPIQDNSERSGNVVLWYEDHGWQLRLAANYRSDRLDRTTVLNGLTSSSLNAEPSTDVLPIWTESTVYVDLSASYDINDNVSVYLQGSNITEEFENQYAQWDDYTITQNIYERRWALGVRARF